MKSVDEIISEWTNDEIVFVNHLIKAERIDSFTKEKALKAIEFQRAIVDGEDEDVNALITGALQKVRALDEEEWNTIKNLAPLKCLDEEIYEE